ncbi:hypothetical protein [Desmospora profundinema]|uniref:LapA family protein n=1 Tax=Desmospora profundinema TaxID=1571184 RepID=A0ABU1IMF6_9BACL|nr:hypothetical protein [Desmospora profundinema]MDR6225961.1 hypothetical protein [Desmospora profundinema]
MSEWPPQVMIGLFFGVGILFSIFGTWAIESALKRRKQAHPPIHRQKS